MLRFPAAAAVLCAAGAALPAHAEVFTDPSSGIQFARITHAGNAPWMGNGTPGDRAIGRGSVPYEYAIGKFEVTTAQWVEFFNAAYDRPANDRIPHLIPPTFWGAQGTTPNTPGGLRWTVPAGNEMRPVGNISWRMAAIYANWLHNGKSTDRAAFLNGAYDVSTFGFNEIGRFTDQLTHHPDAKYWIPTWDEWVKAAHYDPDKNGPDEGGWWFYSNTSDTAYTPGPPGVGTANFGWSVGDFPGQSPFTVLLGAYSPESPFGLKDVAGATGEWTEETFGIPGEPLPIDRGYEGSQWSTPAVFADRVNGFGGGEFPSYSGAPVGFRVASRVIPTPSVLCPVFVVLALSAAHRRRRSCERWRLSRC